MVIMQVSALFCGFCEKAGKWAYRKTLNVRSFLLYKSMHISSKWFHDMYINKGGGVY